MTCTLARVVEFPLPASPPPWFTKYSRAVEPEVLFFGPSRLAFLPFADERIIVSELFSPQRLAKV